MADENANRTTLTIPDPARKALPVTGAPVLASGSLSGFVAGRLTP